MLLTHFDYVLPPDRIAQRPPPLREDARLLRLDPNGSFDDQTISALPDLLPPGALVVLNNTRVMPARLLGHKLPTGGRIELLLVKKIDVDTSTSERQRWRAMGKASKAFRFPVTARFGTEDELDATLLGRADDGLLDVELRAGAGWTVDEAIARSGHMPLPPYLHRDDEPDDRERYQTVYARVPGAVAAPTAGLHLTQALLGRLRLRDIRIASLTLHVGLGTFQPVTVENLDDHPMHEESLIVPPSLAQEIAEARAREAPVIAIGTTVVRALESAADPNRAGYVRSIRATTRLLIQPGYRFQVVDQLLTNFHLPRSTLLSLVAAFGGRSTVLRAYDHAIANGYRFYSYGDAMLLPSRANPDQAAV